MEDDISRSVVEVTRELVVDGHHLRVIAREIDPQQWELAIENPLGVRSVWFEWFASAQAAIDTGVRAIEDEGVETFMDVAGFEYLADSRRA